MAFPITKGTRYAAYPVIGHVLGVPVRLVPHEVVFEEMDEEDHVPVPKGRGGRSPSGNPRGVFIVVR